MFSICYGASVQGIDGKVVRVEIDLSNGLPIFAIVGLPDSAVRESTERVRAALKNGSYEFPMRRITVNLAPADVRKEGASFDLAIAVGILLASGQWPQTVADETMFLGELSLLGEVRPVPGILSMTLAAKEAGLQRIVVPWDNAREAALIEGIRVVPVKRLADVWPHTLDAQRDRLQEAVLDAAAASPGQAAAQAEPLDFADVAGHRQAKRALAVAAAGMHNVLFIGPPGSGKTMLMKRLRSILPPLDDEEAYEVTKIYSASGLLPDRGALVRQRPFRSPHHTITAQGLIGGGSPPRPGEISWAHRGVLFLDELPEFPRAALEALRQPMEEGAVTIARSKSAFTYPARFLLAAAMNPCLCGFDGYDDRHRQCTCPPGRKMSYLSRLSGPLMDRIDLTMDVPRISPEENELWDHPEGGGSGTDPLSSRELYKLVERARLAQLERYRGTAIRSNAELSGRQLHRYCSLNREASKRLLRAYGSLGLSLRAHDRVLKVARTIADIEGSETIDDAHMSEALLYRAFELRQQRLREGESPGGKPAHGH